MLATYVRLHDVIDVEGFVCATIERSPIRATLAEVEREDLIAEGITIMYELAERFEPHRPGYASAGRFSGFAAQFLPRRLGDAWHQRHPEHVRVAGENGKRQWRYYDTPISFDLYVSADAGSRAGQVERSNEARIRPTNAWAAVAPS